MTAQERFYAAFGLYIKFYCVEYFSSDGKIDEEKAGLLRRISIFGHYIRKILEISNFSYELAQARIEVMIQKDSQELAKRILAEIG